MINLLPDTRQSEIRAARVNIILIRYTAIILLALGFLVAILYVSYTVLERTKASAEAQISANDTKADVYSETKTQVDTLSSGLTQAKTVLDQEVRYSKVLTGIAQLMPTGAIIDTLTLDAAAFSGTPTTLKVYAKTSAEAVTLQQNFRTSPLFSNVTFQTLNETDSGLTGYPVSVTMTLVLNKAGV